MARVVSVNISEKKGVIKTAIPEGKFREDHGLEGDGHAGKWHRQVSLLAIESIKKMEQMSGSDLSPGKFAENITTEGIVLHEIPIGTKLKIGETIQEVTQIGKECHTGCEIKNKIGKCIMPTEGIFTRVIQGGIVRAGDCIDILEDLK